MSSSLLIFLGCQFYVLIKPRDEVNLNMTDQKESSNVDETDTPQRKEDEELSALLDSEYLINL